MNALGCGGACKQLAHGLPTDHSSRSSCPPATAQSTFPAPATRLKESFRGTDDFPTLAFNRDSMSGRMKGMKSPCCSQLQSSPCRLAVISPRASALVAGGGLTWRQTHTRAPNAPCVGSQQEGPAEVHAGCHKWWCLWPPSSDLLALFYLHCGFPLNIVFFLLMLCFFLKTGLSAPVHSG